MTSSHSKTKTGQKLAGTMGNREHKEENRLPCPFYKHDSQAHQTMGACFGKGFKDVAHLQEHLRKYHSNSPSHSQIGLMTETQYDEITALNRTFKGDPKGRWCAIYKILFPQEAIPDPFPSLALAQQLEHAARDPDADLIQTFKSKLGQSFSGLDGQFSKDTFIRHFCAAVPAFVEAVQQRYGYGGVEAGSGENTLVSLPRANRPPVDPPTSGSQAVASSSIGPFASCLPPMGFNSLESPLAYSAHLDHDQVVYGANEVPYGALYNDTGRMAYVGDDSVFFEDSIADFLD